MTAATCPFDGCGRPSRTRTEPLCETHYGQRHRGLTLQPIRVGHSGPANGRWSDAAGYFAIHQRLTTQRGPAKDQICSSCGSPARQWSYVGPRLPNERMPFSEDLTQYEPMCFSCHNKADAAKCKTDARWLSTDRSRPNQRKTHCPQDHPYDTENTMYNRGKRCCRICAADQSRRCYQRRRAALLADRQANA